MLNNISRASSFSPRCWEWRAKCNVNALRRGERRLIEWMQSSGEAPKPLKIERQSYGKTIIISLIGRIRADDLAELKKQIDDSTKWKVLDLMEHGQAGFIPKHVASVIRRLSSSSLAFPSSSGAGPELERGRYSTHLSECVSISF